MKLLQGIFLIAIACTRAFGWGCEGHRIVAFIASQHLTPQARTAVYQLLKDNPIDPALDRFCQPAAGDPMEDASTWADDSKREEKTGTWHYLDIPRGVEHADLMKYCAPVGDAPIGSAGADKDRPGCVLTGLQYEFEILKDRNRSSAERATALRYVIHFIGDMHQPLHTTSNDDEGGNCTSVTLFENSERANLHGAWDYGIIAHYLKQNHQTPQEMAAQLDRRYESNGQKWLHERIDFSEWIQEGHRLAQRVTYDKLRPRLPVAPGGGGPGCAAEREKSAALNIHIDARYAAAAIPVIEQQLAKAGYRLADVLNAVF